MTGKRKKILTQCIIEGHYYKKIDNEDVIAWSRNRRISQKLEDHYLVKCERCGDRRLIYDKCYYDRITGKYKL